MELVVYITLAVTSIIGVTFIVERGIALRWRKNVPHEVEAAVENYNSATDLPILRQVCHQHPSPLSRLLLTGADHLHWPREENVDVLETRARHEVTRLERGLVVLEIVVGIAPLLGLVGTVYGLITLFGKLSDVGMGDNASLAKGIGLALYSTLMGLLIAIPSLVAWSYYSKKVETIAVEMQTLCDEFLLRNYRKEDAAATSTSTSRFLNR